MSNSPCNDATKYKALYLGYYHDRFQIETRKRWNDIYMIDVKSHADFAEVKDDK